MNREPTPYEKRRAEIDRELAQIEELLSAKVRHVEIVVRDRVSPQRIVERHLLPSLVVSIIGGIALSRLLGKEASGNVIKRTLRSMAGRWITNAAIRWISSRLPMMGGGAE